MKGKGLSRREFVRLAAVATAGAVATACGGTPTPTPAPAKPAAPAAQPTAVPAAEKKPVTIRFWHHWAGNRVPLMEEQIKSFQAKYPYITVQMTLQPWDNRLEKLLTAVAAGDPVEVTMLGRHDVPSFVVQNALVALDDYMQKDNVTKDLFYATEWSGCQYNGKTWILPMPTGGALTILFYNKIWLKSLGLDVSKPPETWDTFTEWCRKAVVKDASGKLKKVGTSVARTGGEEPYFMVWLYTNGGTWVSDDLKKIQFNSPEGIETMTWIVKFMNEVLPGAELTSAFYSQTGEWENGPFYTDFEAMEIAGSWEFFKIKDYAPKIVNDLGVAALPHGPKGKSQGGAYGGWGYCIPRGVKNLEPAWLLTKWLTVEKSAACWFLQQQKRPSPVISCNLDPASAEGNPYWNDIINVMKQDVLVPITPIQPQLLQVMNTMQDEAIFKRKTPEEALKSGAAECQKLLDEFWAKQKT